MLYGGKVVQSYVKGNWGGDQNVGRLICGPASNITEVARLSSPKSVVITRSLDKFAGVIGIDQAKVKTVSSRRDS